MAIKVNCACGKELMAKDEMAGKKVRCPACKAILLVAAGAAPVRAGGPPPLARPRPGGPPPRPRPPKVQEEDDDEDEDEEEEEEHKPKSRKMREKLQGLSLANIGLLLHLIRFGTLLAIVLTFLICWGLIGMLIGIGAAGGGIGGVLKTIDDLSWVTGVAALLYFPTPFLGIVGSIFCFWVPPKSNGKAPIVVSLSCLAMAHVIPIITIVIMLAAGASMTLPDMWANSRFALVVFALGIVCWLATDIAFFAFLRNMCRYVDQDQWAEKADGLMVMWTLMIFAPPALAAGAVYGLVTLGMPDIIVVIITYAFFIGILVAETRILITVMRIITAIRKVISKNLD